MNEYKYLVDKHHSGLTLSIDKEWKIQTPEEIENFKWSCLKQLYEEAIKYFYDLNFYKYIDKEFTSIGTVRNGITEWKKE